MIKEDIIKKVVKCMALSKSPNANEAALALERARELMEKYRITINDIELSEISDSTAAAGNTRTLPAHIHILICAIEKAFACHAVLSICGFMGKYKNVVHYVGFCPNPEIAAYCFSVLFRQMEVGRKAYLKSISKRIKPNNKAKLSAIWADGWVASVYSRIMGMALNDNEEMMIDKYVQNTFGALSKSKARNTRLSGLSGQKSYDAFLDGHDKGRNVKLDRAMTSDKKMEIGM